MYKNVVVPVNLEAESGAMAIEEAVDIARSMDAKLHLLTVVIESRGDEDAENPMVETRKEFVEEAVDIADRKLGEDDYVVVEKFGNAGEEICELAEELEDPVIVMSTHGRKGLRLLALGSTTWKTIRNAPCPVLSLTSDIKEVSRD